MSYIDHVGLIHIVQQLIARVDKLEKRLERFNRKLKK